MPRKSPTLEGFRAVFRQPALPLAEITWRWSFGTTVCALNLFALFAFLDTLPVTSADLFLLRTRQPFLVSQAIAHILHGSAFRFVMAGIVLFTALSVGWIIAASFGRAATVRWLLDYFRERRHKADLAPTVPTDDDAAQTAQEPQAEPRIEPAASQPLAVASLFGVHFLRVALTLAAATGCVGAALLAGFASSRNDPSPGLVVLLFIPMLCLIWMAWSVLNWVLSLAAILVVRDGHDTFGAVAAAVALYRDRRGPMLASSFWFGLAHLIAFFLASSVVAFPLGFASVLPGGVVLGGVLGVTLIYFAVADWLYVGRLAAYVAILESPAAPAIAQQPEAQPQLSPGPAAATTPAVPNAEAPQSA